MNTYHEFRPTSLDAPGLNLADRQDWLVLPTTQNRDSGPYQVSNFEAAKARLLQSDPKAEDHECHCFGHWACGWFEIILVRPNTPAHTEALSIEADLENYPLLNENDVQDREHAEAQEVWQHCYTPKQRIAYIRKHESQFDGCDWRTLLANVRGEYFSGYASELVS